MAKYWKVQFVSCPPNKLLWDMGILLLLLLFMPQRQHTKYTHTENKHKTDIKLKTIYTLSLGIMKQQLQTYSHGVTNVDIYI